MQPVGLEGELRMMSRVLGPILAGQEIANAYSELNDPLEQKMRFEEQIASLDSEERKIKKLDKFSKIKTYKLPELFNGELRDYQKAGYDWMNFLKDFSFGGILADDMGLGKTIQALVLLRNEITKTPKKCNLIIVSSSIRCICKDNTRNSNCKNTYRNCERKKSEFIFITLFFRIICIRWNVFQFIYY